MVSIIRKLDRMARVGPVVGRRKENVIRLYLGRLIYVCACMCRVWLARLHVHYYYKTWEVGRSSVCMVPTLLCVNVRRIIMVSN